MLEYSMLYPVNSISRRSQPLDGMWRFYPDLDQQGDRPEWHSGIPGQDLIPVPASFQDFYTDKDIRELAGDVWYQRDFFVPAEWKGKNIFLRFGEASYRAVVYVNGCEAARHSGGCLPFSADITGLVGFGSHNRVVVRVNNELSEEAIPCGTTIRLSDGRKMNKPYFDFFPYSGLQRSVYLMAVPAEAVEDIDLRYELDGEDAKVYYSIRTSGSHDVSVSLKDEDGVTVAECPGREGTLLVENACLWRVRDAYLYLITVRITDGDEILDEYSQEIGIRTVEISGTDILINGESVYLRGFGKHEDSEIAGHGTNNVVMKRDFELMKWIGANTFRTAHYPYSEEIYRMADREGILVIDEVPAVGMYESQMFMDINVDEGIQRKPAFFKKKTIGRLLESHMQAVEEMITRDKNHPSVIAWSLLNEPETTDISAIPYFEKIFDLAGRLDPQKRPRTFAMLMESTPDVCKCYQFSDFISLNRYYGWYTKGGGEIVDAEKLFRDEMDQWEALKLNKPFIFTEYGADTCAYEHSIPSRMWSQEYQSEFLEMMHRVFDSYGFVRGELMWNFADFQTTEGIMRVDGNKKGAFTRHRQPKAAALVLKNRWEELPSDYKSGLRQIDGTESPEIFRRNILIV